MTNKRFQEILDTLSDPVRFKLLNKIISAQKLYNYSDETPYRGNCITELRKSTELTQPTISHHIKLLENVRLIEAERHGKWIHFVPKVEQIEEFKEILQSKFQLGENKSRAIGTVEAEINETQLKSLVSLLENHEYKVLHTTKRQETTVVYMSHTTEKAIYTLIFNPLTQLLTLRGNEEKSPGQKDTELLGLAKKYIPTL